MKKLAVFSIVLCIVLAGCSGKDGKETAANASNTVEKEAAKDSVQVSSEMSSENDEGTGENSISDIKAPDSVENLPEDVYSGFLEENTQVNGRVYEFGDKEDYSLSSEDNEIGFLPGENTYGYMSLSGDLTENTDGGMTIPAYDIGQGQPSLYYTYGSSLLDADEDHWHLVGDNGKEVGDIEIGEKINKGVMILESSLDGISWSRDKIMTNLFSDMPVRTEPLYVTKDIQLTNGCFFRVIVAYKLGIRTGEKKVAMVTTDTYEYKKRVEIYEVYLQNAGAKDKTADELKKTLGSVVNTGTDNGYSGSDVIDRKDPHYGWEIGRFFVSGYTRETRDDNNPVFLKNVGDKVTLWFKLEQDIDKLDGNENLSIADDTNGQDQYFQTEKTDMGRGTLIVRYTDHEGVKHTPEIYTNYLQANTTTSADTIVRLFEEGDYEVALDYEIKNTPRKVGAAEIIPEYTNYRIFFTFSVRNGNCMVYPFDLSTGAELSDGAITENGFKLDMAKSRYLTIDVTRTAVTAGNDGITEDVRFNRPAKDGDEYTDDGIYIFNVKNLYTGENTQKTIYVGGDKYLRALSVNKMTVSELNEAISKGRTLAADGQLQDDEEQ